MARRITALCLAVLALWQGAAFARAPEEAEFVAATLLGDEIASWIDGLERRPNSIGIFSVHSNYPLEQDYSTIVETEILKGFTEKSISNVTSCSECRAPHLDVSDERIVITKGAPDMETLKRIGRKQPVETFLTVDIYRTKLSILVQAVLYQNPTGVVVAAERFRIPALNFSDMATQVLLTAGAGFVTQGQGQNSGLVNAVNISLLEEIGFAKAGLTIGTLLGNGSLTYVVPTFAFRGRFGSSALAWSLNLGAGYGFTPNVKGINARVSLEIFLGTFTVVGLEAMQLIPEKATTDTQGYAGFHIGLSLGR